MNSEALPQTLPLPRVWFHAVSVGEVVALSPLVKRFREIRPDAGIVVSTGTETGYDRACAMIPEAHGFLFLPLDFPFMVNRVVERVAPDLFVLMETELWPNLIHSLKTRGASVVLANGRISDRSFPRYRILRDFFASTLGQIDLFLMASDTDAERIVRMNAARARVRVTGNTKFDAALGERPDRAEGEMRDLLGLDRDTMTLVAGSTHPGEHEIVLDAYSTLLERFPDLVLVVAPRHVEKTPSILSAMKERGMAPPFLRSSADHGEARNGRRVVIVDRTGELFKVFSLATVVFMGGSLVPKGGQNILEPASWGKMVFFGPSMGDFREARDILAHVGAAAEVTGREDLVEKIAEALSNPERSADRGRKGRAEVMKHVGSADRNAKIIAELLTIKETR